MITLEQAKVGMSDPVDQKVVDEFRRGSYLLDRLVFDNVVSPGTGGSTLAYGYTRLKTPSTASFRGINEEYQPNEALREEHTGYCKIFGGTFELDRVIIKTSGAIDELDFQMQEKIKGAINLFHYTAINGDRMTNPKEFDGIDVMVTGSSTEYDEGVLDVSTSALLDTEYHRFLDMLDEYISGMNGKPDMLMCNTKLATKMKAVARRAGYYTRSEDAFGESIECWNGIPIIDLEDYADPLTQETKPIVPIDSNGVTSLYGIQIGRDALHGISPEGNGIISTALPDLSAPGVVKKGDVEMIAGLVLKNTRKAGVFRNIKVQ